MSQAGALNSTGGGSGNIQTVTGNTGGPVSPTANNINIVGTGTISVSGNPGTSTLTISSSAPTGVSTIALQNGTSPIAPTAGGLITFVGQTVSPGTDPVRTDGTGPNTMALQVQVAQSIAAPNLQNVGLASFNSAQFSVDASGFVSSTSSSGITTINGDTGSVTGSTISIISNVATTASGATVKFTGSGTTLTYSNTAANNYMAIGNGAGGSASAITDTVYLGANAGSGSSTIARGVFIGHNAGTGQSGTSDSVIIGNNAALSSSSTNLTCIGSNSGGSASGCNNSVFLGTSSAAAAGGASNSVFLGYQTGVSSGSSNCIFIGANTMNGTASSNAIAIGTPTTASGTGSICIGGSSTANATNSIVLGNGAGATNTNAVAIAQNAGATGLHAIAIGNSTLAAGSDSICIGTSCVDNAGASCVTIGPGASSGSGGFSTIFGSNAGTSNSTGGDNIYILNAGSSGESNVIRIGTQGSGNGQQNQCFVAGIAGVSVSNTNMVTIDTTTGKMGSQAVPAGTVTSVSGTTNQVAVATGTTTPVISLIGPYTPSTYTTHGVLIGEATSSIVAVANVAASGIPLISQTAADPTFGTAAIAGGGTGVTSFGTSNGIVVYNGTNLVNYAGPQISSGGIATNTQQPAFLAYLTTTVTNVTGDGTTYTLIYDTEVFDQNSDFDLATSTFTAPVTGKYQINVNIRTQGGTVLTAGTAVIVTSNRSYRSLVPNVALGGANTAISMNVLADMDAADTFTITLNLTDTGGKTDDISGDGGTGNPFNWVSANLVC